MMAANIPLIVILGLACIYTLISSILILSAVSRITGKELRHLMIALLITVISGFLYGLLQLLLQLGIMIEGRQLIDYATNLLLFAMFVMLVYLSFLVRELGKRFGFRMLGKKIKKKLKSK